MSFASSLRRFHDQLSRVSASAWSAKVTLSTDALTPRRAVACSASPPERIRLPDEQRAGWIQRTTRVFLLPRSLLDTYRDQTATFAGGLTAPVQLGTELTIVEDARNPQNVGTSWRVFDLRDSDAGSDLRARAFRLDP